MTILNKLEEAVTAHQAGQLDEAVRLYGIVLDAQPRNPVANYNLGGAFSRNPKSEGRLSLIQKCDRFKSRRKAILGELHRRA